LAIGEGQGTLELNLAVDLVYNLVEVTRRRGDLTGAVAAIRRVLPLLPADHPRTVEVRGRLEALIGGEAGESG
jgi:RecB family endonuclease NucS